MSQNAGGVKVGDLLDCELILCHQLVLPRFRQMSLICLCGREPVHTWVPALLWGTEAAENMLSLEQRGGQIFVFIRPPVSFHRQHVRKWPASLTAFSHFFQWTENMSERFQRTVHRNKSIEIVPLFLFIESRIETQNTQKNLNLEIFLHVLWYRKYSGNSIYELFVDQNPLNWIII